MSVPPYDISKLASVYKEPHTLRAAYVALARWAQRAERYEDMTRIVRELVVSICKGVFGPTPLPNNVILMSVSGIPPQVQVAPPPNTQLDSRDITAEERTLLMTAYKSMILPIRQAWRSLKFQQMELNSKGAANSNNDMTDINNGTNNMHISNNANHMSDSSKNGIDDTAMVLDEYRLALERELLTVVVDLTSLLESTLLTVVSSTEAKVFYLKLAADFYRYATEVLYNINGTIPINSITQPIMQTLTPIPVSVLNKSAEYYALAYKLSGALEPTHPHRLGVALNYSVLLYEVINDRLRACEMCRGAFDAAIARLDECDEQHYKESTVIMQMIRDNLSTWTNTEQQ